MHRALLSRPSVGRIPLPDGEGLYGAGRNAPPSHLARAAAAAAASIRPLDRRGRPSAHGRIGLISVGMSNTTMEFAEFARGAARWGGRNPRVAVVDCAQGGADCRSWAVRRGWPWREMLRRLRSARVSPRQVQVIWLKHGLAMAPGYGGFAAHVRRQALDTLLTVRHLRRLCPNLKLVILSSRIYGGWATGPLNPEPWAWESGLAVRRAILEWRGKMPVLVWGPYLWADGVKARRDGLRWPRRDFTADGVHPSAPGRAKVARLLLDFLRNDPAAGGWFARR